MGEKVTAVLDLTDCRTLGDLHIRIKKALHFPEFYGKIGVLFGIPSTVIPM